MSRSRCWEQSFVHFFVCGIKTLKILPVPGEKMLCIDPNCKFLDRQISRTVKRIESKKYFYSLFHLLDRPVKKFENKLIQTTSRCLPPCLKSSQYPPNRCLLLIDYRAAGGSTDWLLSTGDINDWLVLLPATSLIGQCSL